MKSPLRGVVPALLLLGGGLAPSAPAAPVGGGSLTGKVLFRGEVPKVPGRPIVAQNEVCGYGEKPNQVLKVGPEGGFGNVVVSLEGRGLRKASPPQEVKPVLDQVECVFTPHILLVRSGKPFLIRNSDPIFHNSHGFSVEGRYSRFNIGIKAGGKDKEVVERNSGGIAIRCDAGHPWMHSFVYVAPNAFSRVTGLDGTFSLEGIPPGRYTLRFWHEYLDELELRLTIEEGKEHKVFVRGSLLPKAKLVQVSEAELAAPAAPTKAARPAPEPGPPIPSEPPPDTSLIPGFRPHHRPLDLGP